MSPRLGYTEASLDRYCPSCGARPGALCMSMGGRVLSERPHNPRAREKVAAPRRKADVSQATRRALVRRSGGWCEVCPLLDPTAPRHPGEEAHHKRLRSLGGTNDLDNLVLTCRRGHNLVHDHPELARAQALLTGPTPKET